MKIMNKFWYVAIIALCAVVVTSCKDDDDEIDEVWKSKNEQAFYDISNNSEYKKLTIDGSGSLGIYYKVLKKGEGERKPYFNSKVKAYYTGWLIDTDKSFQSFEPPYQTPQQFNVDGVVQGWAIALQNMVEGDRWEIWIPQQLGYAEAGSASGGIVIIPPYSTLKFEMELVEIVDL